jgi:mannitol-1-phosphate 5-dehydrogenase
MSERPTVVQFGAGAIGRGFLGQLWSQAGYEVVYVDINRETVAALNQRRHYPLRLVSNDGSRDIEIGPVRGYDLREHPVSIPAALARCAFACTAVGVNAFLSLAPLIGKAVAARAAIVRNRWEPVPEVPLNIICCENQQHAASELRKACAAAVPPSDMARGYFASHIGFVDASVGRMVPPPTPELLAEDRLLIAAEPYAELPIDGDAWLGPVPPIPGLLPKSNFAAYVARKLFTHNGGHAVLAYHGFMRGHNYIWQALEDPFIRAELLGFWDETGAALIAAYGFDPAEQRAHEADLLRRFANRALGDTVVRVGRDPKRKLRADDRLVGAGLLCLQTRPDTIPSRVCHAIAAGLRFEAPDDPTAGEVRTAVQERGAANALATFTGLSVDAPLIRAVAAVYNEQAARV